MSTPYVCSWLFFIHLAETIKLRRRGIISPHKLKHELDHRQLQTVIDQRSLLMRIPGEIKKKRAEIEGAGATDIESRHAQQRRVLGKRERRVELGVFDLLR